MPITSITIRSTTRSRLGRRSADAAALRENAEVAARKTAERREHGVDVAFRDAEPARQRRRVLLGGDLRNDAAAAGIVLGARVPIVLTSRADSLTSRVASCAVAALVVAAKHKTLLAEHSA